MSPQHQHRVNLSQESISSQNKPKPIEFPSKVNPIFDKKSKDLRFTSKTVKP